MSRVCVCVCVHVSYQGSTAEQNHEDDEGFKPVVFNNQVAGLPQEPPVFPPAVSNGNVTALVLGHTLCITNKYTSADKHRRDRCIRLPRTSAALIACTVLTIIPVYSVLLYTTKSDHKHLLPSVQQASGSRYSSTTSTTATSSTSGLMSIVLPSDELVSSS